MLYHRRGRFGLGLVRVSLGLVLVSFLLVWGSLGLVRFEFEVLGPFRFPGFPVNRFPHSRYALF